MKKIIALLIISLIALSSISAFGNENFGLSLMGKVDTNSLSLTLGEDSSSFGIVVTPICQITLEDVHNINLGLALGGGDGFILGLNAGYSYTFDITDSLDLDLGAGFSWYMNTLGSDSASHNFAFELLLDFRYVFYDNYFFTFGAENRFDFASVLVMGTSSTSSTGFSSTLTLPTIGFGYTF